MKTKLIAIALSIATIITVAFYPATNNARPQQTSILENLIPNEKPKIEVVFALDTTGSMGGLIQAAKEKIWSIASNMASAQGAPEIKIGLVAYRDRGDAYVTRVVDLSDDLDSVYATLMDFRADGGGDGPESVNQALYDSVHRISWGQDKNAYKVIFLVGDAPPHMDYQDDVKYPVSIAAAKQKGIVVNSIQCGSQSDTRKDWLRVARLGNGEFFEVSQAGSAVAISTPFDEKIAKLSEELDDTRLFYGNKAEQQRQALKRDASDKLHAFSSTESRARRAIFNTSKSGKKNFVGEKELVEEITSGRIELDDVKEAELPATLQAMAPDKRKEVVEKNAAKRKELQQKIADLGKRRQAYMKKKVEEAGGARDSLDVKLYEAVKQQAESKGLVYSDSDMAY